MARQQNPMRRSWLDETDGGWVPQTLTLKVSPAWRHRPIPLIRILERIEIEHLRHGGAENGGLIVTYDQFVEHGVSRRTIRGSLALGAALGLLEVRQSGEWAGDIRTPNTYRLTYLPEKGRRAPTDEWKGVGNEAAKIAVAQYQKGLGKKPTSQCQKVQPTSAKSGARPTPTSAKSDKSPVPEMELLYISRGKPPTAGAAGSISAVHAQSEDGPTVNHGAQISSDTADSSQPDAIEKPPQSAALSDTERSLLRWLVNFAGQATHRKAQQNLSGQLKGEVISTVAKTLADMGLLKIEEAGRSRVYILLDAGRDPALLNDSNQLDLESWLSTAAQ